MIFVGKLQIAAGSAWKVTNGKKLWTKSVHGNKRRKNEVAVSI